MSSRSRLKFWKVAVMLLVCALSGPSRNADGQQMQVPENADYSKFKHESAYHARLPCLLCHRRETNAARPQMPGSSNHSPCAGCHVKQFADRASPICLNCHTEVQSGALKPFPRAQSFRMVFDHGRHVSMNNISCSTCHRPARRGVALSIPAGFNAHGACFGCHSPGAKSGERDISACSVCHTPGRPQRIVETARAFAVGFSHSRHGRSAGLNCTECHRVRAGVAQNEVSSPQPLNHHASARSFSCMSCHNGKRAFGGDDFSACKKCHKGAYWHF